jgi:hypothetical protein
MKTYILPIWVKTANLHPAIGLAAKHGYTYWPTILAQNPIISTDNRLSYFQNSEKKARNLRTVTTTGKYIKRHFPKIQDHILRDIVAKTEHNLIILDNSDDMVNAVINGPFSCMSGNKFSADKYHPYRAYDPVYGWKMAIRKSGDRIVARAILHNDTFVRCFASTGENNDYASGADNILEALLIDNGYTKLSGYKLGAKLARIEFNNGELVGPYIDGCNDNGVDMGDYLKLSSQGDIEFNNTSGRASNDSAFETCSDCGCRMHSDDAHCTGDDYVCESCIDEYFYVESTRVNGRYVGDYYVRMNDTIVTIEGDRFCENNYSDHYIVELKDGRYTHMDNAIMCEVTNDYYHQDDIGTEIFHCTDTEDYRSCDYWQCTESLCYYSDDIEPHTLENGMLVHPDTLADVDTIEMF